MKIKLPNNLETEIDNDDEWVIEKYCGWYVNHRGYVLAGIRRSRKKIILHRVIMNAQKGIYIDHIDGNKLNNKKTNLRFATPTQNAWNKKFKLKKKYIGVFKFKSKSNGSRIRKRTTDKEWYALISYTENGKRITKYIGYYDTELEAAKAYNEESIKIRGEFAMLNSI